jgi:hypothetical protein
VFAQQAQGLDLIPSTGKIKKPPSTSIGGSVVPKERGLQEKVPWISWSGIPRYQPWASVASHTCGMLLQTGCLSLPTDAEKGGSLVVGDFEIAAKYGEWHCVCWGEGQEFLAWLLVLSARRWASRGVQLWSPKCTEDTICTPQVHLRGSGYRKGLSVPSFKRPQSQLLPHRTLRSRTWFLFFFLLLK